MLFQLLLLLIALIFPVVHQFLVFYLNLLVFLLDLLYSSLDVKNFFLLGMLGLSQFDRLILQNV